MFSHSPADYRNRQVQQRFEISDLLLVAHAQLAIVVHPGVSPLDNPAPSSSLGSVAGLGGSPRGHVRNIAALPHLLVCGFARVALVHAEVLGTALCRLRPWNHDRVQCLCQQLHVVPIGPGDDKRERGATAVHQQAALGPFFSPDLSGYFPPPLGPKGPCPESRPNFAIPRQSLPSRRTPPVPHATNERKSPLAATAGNDGESRWRCRNSWATPSTDNRCAARTRWRRKYRAVKWACARHLVSVETFAFAPRADRTWAKAIRPATKARRKLPKIELLACGNHCKVGKSRQLLFTDKLLVLMSINTMTFAAPLNEPVPCLPERSNRALLGGAIALGGLLPPFGGTHAKALLKESIEQTQAPVTAVQGNLGDFLVRLA